MAQYNFLSGSSIDATSNFLFDAISSGYSYLGYSRGTPENQWGINTLIHIEHTHVAGVSQFPDCVAVAGSSLGEDKFYDLNSANYIDGVEDSYRSIFIAKYANTDTNLENAEMLTDVGSLKLSYVGKNWVLIQGLEKDYYNYLTPSTTASYYILNYNQGNTNPMKIKEKSILNVPYYTQNCVLRMSTTGASGTFNIVKENIQRTINFLGEVYVSGMTDPPSIPEGNQDSIFNESGTDATLKKETLTASGSVFRLTDTAGNTLIDNMTFVDPAPTNAISIYTEVTGLGNSSQKYLTFSYEFYAGQIQYMKFIVGAKNTDELAIWNERYAYDAVTPIADSNPPGLDVLYLKDSAIHKSIFDVNGFIKINPSVSGEIKYVKEITNSEDIATYEALGFTVETLTLTSEELSHIGTASVTAGNGDDTIYLNNFHTFVVGDQIKIPYDPLSTGANPPTNTYSVTAVEKAYGSGYIKISPPLVIDGGSYIPLNYQLSSELTTNSAVITLATTTDKDKAIDNSFYNVMITKTVDLTGANSPTENVYRQLFIAYKAKDASGSYLYDQDVYNGDTSVAGVNFNPTSWEYDNGLILYLANKIAVYRKWANAAEELTLII